MSNAEILIKLRELHEQLSEMSEVLDSEDMDESTIDALGQLVTDVSGLVDRARELSSDADHMDEREKIMERINEFQSEHPGITRFLSQVTDVLAMIGL